MIFKDGHPYIDQFEFDTINLIDNDMLAPLSWNNESVTFLIKDEKNIIDKFRRNPLIEIRKGLIYLTYKEITEIPIVYMYITMNDEFDYKTCFIPSEQSSKLILDSFLDCRNYNFLLASSTNDISVVQFTKPRELLFGYDKDTEYDSISSDVFFSIVDAFNSLDNKYFLNILIDIENGTRSKYLTFHTNN